MVNPYFCYAFTFIVALVAYMFGWSDLYPSLTLPVSLFLITSIAVFSVFGVITLRSNVIGFRKIEIRNHTYPLLITLFIYGLWTIEFIDAGGIPLLKILLKQPYNYRIFGVKSLHVFIVTFSSFYTIYLFHLYLSQKSVVILILYGINLISAILIYNRGMLFFNLSATTCLYLIYKGTVHWKQIIAGSIIVIVTLFFFGVLGSLRVSREAKKTYTNSDFLGTGRASESFRKSIVPSEFFWSYIYVSSPIANLQNNINTFPVKEYDASRVLEWINNEILFDFISKRINAYSNKDRESENTIPGPFNASTVYSRSFSYLRWGGLLLMSIVVLLIPLGLYKLLPSSSPFFLTGLAILNTVFLFMVFDNTLRFTGLSFQLVYPIVLTWGVSNISWVKKIFQ